MFSNELPPGLKAFAEREFLGERVVWIGQPDPRRSAVAAWPIVFLGIIWTVVAVTVSSTPIATLFHLITHSDGSALKRTEIAKLWDQVLLLVPLLSIGVGLMVYPLHVSWNCRRTLYVLTERRLAMLKGDSFVTITSLRPSDIAEIRREQEPGDYGTLIIEHDLKRDPESRDPLSKKAKFGVIADVRRVDNLVQKFKESGA